MLHPFFKITILTQNVLLKMLGIFEFFKVNVELDIIIIFIIWKSPLVVSSSERISCPLSIPAIYTI